jgi:hypothetical protein
MCKVMGFEAVWEFDRQHADQHPPTKQKETLP